MLSQCGVLAALHHIFVICVNLPQAPQHHCRLDGAQRDRASSRPNYVQMTFTCAVALPLAVSDLKGAPAAVMRGASVAVSASKPDPGLNALVSTVACEAVGVFMRASALGEAEPGARATMPSSVAVAGSSR